MDLRHVHKSFRISTWGAVGIIIGYTHGKNFHEWDIPL